MGLKVRALREVQGSRQTEERDEEHVYLWLQYSDNPLEKEMASTPVFLQENPMVCGAWWAAVHGAAKVRHDLASKQLLLIPMIWKAQNTKAD